MTATSSDRCAALAHTSLCAPCRTIHRCHGAFTGAAQDKEGLLEVADGGTLFLD